jgi:membrane protein
MNPHPPEDTMVPPQARTKEYHDWLQRLLRRAPDRPGQLPARMWWRVVRRTIAEFFEDELMDRAAALTYYSIMSIFPGLLLLVSGLGLLGPSTTEDVLNNIQDLAPGPARDILARGIENLQSNQQTAGVLAIIGFAIAFWSATGYIGGFMRAANSIYDVPEARPFWKTIPIQLVVTAVTGIFLAVSALAVVFTGRLAQVAGRTVGIEQQAVRVFDIVKWPVLVLAAGMIIALLYWAAPNARQAGFRWITPGSGLAVLIWVAASGGFAFYISQFNSYNRTYGTLGGVIIFLVWLWLTNLAVLIGAEFDAELGRSRAILAGLPPESEPYLPLRDMPRRWRRAAKKPKPTPAEKPAPAERDQSRVDT